MHDVYSEIVYCIPVGSIIQQQLAEICVALKRAEMKRSESITTSFCVDKSRYLCRLHGLRYMPHNNSCHPFIIVETGFVQERVPSFIENFLKTNLFVLL